MTGVLSFPFSSPPLGGLRVMSCGSITKHQLYISRCSSSPSSSPSIRPDYTSNGSLSQQPPTVMESCSGEHPLLCTSAPPLPSSHSFSVLNTQAHTNLFLLMFIFAGRCLHIEYRQKEESIVPKAFQFIVPNLPVPTIKRFSNR